MTDALPDRSGQADSRTAREELTRTPAKRGTGRRGGARVGRLVAPVLGLIVFFGVWELLVRAFDVRTFVLLGPSTIFDELLGQPGFYWRNTLVTTKEALLGYL